LSGALSLSVNAELERVVDKYRDLFASLRMDEHRSDLSVVPDRLEYEELALSGYARECWAELASAAKVTDDNTKEPTDDDTESGVGAAEIQLDSTITIVEGDNEAGKSSFIEALNLLFRERDSTKKQELKRVTPKGVDVGSQVEVEFTTGPYHLTYSKTFNKKSATTLFIHKPGTVQLVGAEAHDRVLQILDETIDFGLWQAIQLEQGGEFTQVNFKR